MKKILLILFILFTTQQAFAATYYVANGGDDEAAGTAEAPWETVAQAISSDVHEGDTVYFNSGDTWALSGDGPFATVTGAIYDGKTWGDGTRAKLQYTGSTAYSVVQINGTPVNASLRSEFRGFEIDCNEQQVTGLRIGTGGTTARVTVDDCVIHDTSSTGGSGFFYALNVTWGATQASDVIIENCTMYNIAAEILTVYPQSGGSASNVTIRNCDLSNGGESESSSHYGIGVEIKNTVSNVTVEFCHLHNLCYAGVHLDNEHATGPTSTILRYNIIHDAQNGILFQQRRTDNESADIYGNLIYDIKDKTNGVNGRMAIQLPTSSAINVYNNTIYTETAHHLFTAERGAITAAGAGLTMNVKNNIIYTVLGIGIYDAGGDFTHSDNIVYRASGTAVTDDGSNYTSAQITNWDETALGSDPTFTGGTLPTGFSGTYGSNMVPNTDYFQLTVDSPAKDTGATLEGYTGCINGAGLTTPIVRPLGAAFDIGAYEYGTVAQTGGSVGSGFTMKGATFCGSAGATSYCSTYNTCPGNDCAIVCEDFEGSVNCSTEDYPNCRIDWYKSATTSVDFQNATSPAPIEGAYSVLWDAGTLGTLGPDVFTGVDNLYGYFAVNWGTIAVSNYTFTTIMNLQAGPTPKMYVKLYKPGTGTPYKLAVACASTNVASTATFTPDTGVVYHIFWEYEKAGGTDGATRCKAGIYSDAAKTTLLAEAEDLVGNADATITSFAFEQNDGKVDAGKWDKLKIHTSVIGGQ